MRKTMTVELSAEGIAGGGYYYAALKLPAQDHELRDAMQKLRLINGRKAWMGCSVQLCESLPELADTRLDTPSLEELNFFAYRLTQLSGAETMALRGVWLHMEPEEPVSLKDMINMTFGLDDVVVVAGVFSDEDLGQMVVENDLNEDIAKLSEASIALLDLEAVGKHQRETEGGILVDGHYVVAGGYRRPEFYDGQALPETEPGEYAVFRIQIADSVETEWIARMAPVEQMKLKAVVEAEKPATMDEILDIAQHLGDYQLEYRVTDADGFFKEYLRRHLDPRFDSKWLESMSAETEGRELLERLGARETAYGIVSARGRPLYEIVPYQQEQVQEEALDMTMGGY
ncbi:MAG: hypothetical protein IJZ39_08070 [Oscillospiraceae bacterium]|nr:hypothetical protein [Oscillospiraceae bacterium]